MEEQPVKAYVITTGRGDVTTADVATIKAMLLSGSLAAGDTVMLAQNEGAQDGSAGKTSRLDGEFAEQHFEIDVLFRPVVAHRRFGARLGAKIGAFGIPVLMLPSLLRDTITAWSTVAYYLVALFVQFGVVMVLLAYERKVLAWIWGFFSFVLMLGALGVIVLVPAALIVQSTVGGVAGTCLGAGCGIVIGFLRRKSFKQIPS